MAGLLVRLRLFISSYAPLFAILAIRFRDHKLEVACALLAALGAASLFLLLRAAGRIQPDPHRIDGYRVSAVTTGDGWSGVLVSRGQPRPGSAVLASRLQNTLALERTRERHGPPVATRPPERSRR